MKGMIYISANKIASLFLTAAAALSLTVMTASIIANKKNEEKFVSAAPQISQYTLKDYKGHLAVFVNDEKIPEYEFNIPTSSFSEYDRELLKYGITADTKEKIDKLIEDYTS